MYSERTSREDSCHESRLAMGLQQHHKELITATILAGGKSSRMGTDKALIPINGSPLIAQIYQVARACADEVWVITPWIEKYQGVLPNNCCFIREIPLAGGKLNHGPLVGFYQGLSKVETEWVLLLACDLPCLSSQELLNWCKYLPKVAEEVMALLPRNSKGWEPLCGFYRRGCLSSLAKFINGGGRSFQRWLAQEKVQELTVSNPQILFNCNTPEDLEEVKHHSC